MQKQYYARKVKEWRLLMEGGDKEEPYLVEVDEKSFSTGFGDKETNS